MYNTATECSADYAAKLGRGPLVAGPQAPIPAAMVCLLNQINDAHSAVSRLEDRLGAVLEQPMAQPGGINGKTERGPSCEHHSALLELQSLVETLTARLNNIHNRLAL